MSKANDQQHGGSHYKTGGEEHWDRVARLRLNYFEGQITKYVERCRKKNGVEDLKKAGHFIQKYIELWVENPQLFADKPPLMTITSAGAAVAVEREQVLDEVIKLVGTLLVPFERDFLLRKLHEMKDDGSKPIVRPDDRV